jgi:hypothetical protein
MSNDFLIEKRLAETSPELSNLMTESTFALKSILKSYTTVFPDFTDHTIIHSLNVLNYCNKLIGEEQAAKLNADECYVLIMACYLHDTGMGISMDDYERFSGRIDFGEYFETRDPDDLQKTIRDYHHEYSGLFVGKYKDLFEIPSEEHLLAIMQVVRGHRKTDLFDEAEYPDIRLADGNVIHTPYLAAILRLADDLDVAVDRVPELLYDITQLTKTKDIIAFGTHHTIRSVEIIEEEIILYVNEDSEEFMGYVLELRDEIDDTLRYCTSVCAQRTPFIIRQQRLVITGLPSD